MRKVIDVSWYSCGISSVGIVITENERKERKAYIGVSEGCDETVDTKHIMEYGAKLPIEILQRLIKVLENK